MSPKWLLLIDFSAGVWYLVISNTDSSNQCLRHRLPIIIFPLEVGCNHHLTRLNSTGPICCSIIHVWFLSVICALVVLLTDLQTTHMGKTGNTLLLAFFPLIKHQFTQSSDRNIS